VPITTGLAIAVGLILTLADPGARDAVGFVAALSLAGATTIGLVYPGIARRLRRRLLLRRNSELVASLHDPKRLRRVFDDVTDGYRALGLAPDLYWELMSALVLLQEERWSEARGVLEGIDPARIEAPADLVMYENNLAWALAQDGAPGEAAAVAQRALDRISSASNQASVHLASLNGTLGAALTLDGRHAAAIAPLRRAIDSGGLHPVQATRRYYLGAALLALGEVDEARKAWEQARAEAPSSRWGQLAAQRLATEMQPPYR
jgi:tetratricopeptide (TPR) repeat protein